MASVGADFDIAEIIGYDHTLSVDEENVVGYYLEEKYGLTTAYVPPSPALNNEPGPIVRDGGVMALLRGTLLSARAPTADLWVYWGPTDGSNSVQAWSNNFHFGDSAAGIYSATIGPLAQYTNYYYRFAASNSYGLGWAPTTAQFRSGGGTFFIVR